MPMLAKCYSISHCAYTRSSLGLLRQTNKYHGGTLTRMHQTHIVPSSKQRRPIGLENSKARKLLDALHTNKVTPDYVLESIEAWVNPVGSDAHPGALMDALTVFQELLRHSQQSDENKTKVRIGVAYSYLMHALLRNENTTDNNDRLVCASQLRDTMGQWWNRTSNREVTLSAATLNANMLFLCKTGKLKEAESILRSMMRQEDNGNLFMAPDIIGINIMIHGYAKEGAVKEAKELIHLMIERNKNCKSKVVPDIISLHGVLQAYANSSIFDAAEQAESFLMGMEESAIFVADTLCYTSLIHIYAKSHKRGSATRAEHILQRMMTLEQQGMDIHVDAVSFSAVIDALSKSNEADSVVKAQRLFETMERLATSGKFHIAPNVATYNSLINVIAKSKNNNAGREALEVLQRMRNTNDVKPNEITFNTIISALVHSRQDESDTAIALLSEMKNASNAKPDIVTYNAVLHVLSRSKRSDSHDVALALLQEMHLHRDTAPSTITYNIIMLIIANRFGCAGAERIEGMLKDLEDSDDLQPNKQSYTTAITMWARSQSPEKVQKSRSIFDRMKFAYRSGNENCKPDIMVYNAMLNCCCFPIGGREEASSVAMETFSDIRESGYALSDSVTYAFMLKALGRNLQTGYERDAKLRQVFDAACDDGLVDGKVLEQLTIASTHLFRNILAENGGNVNTCPKSWSRNTDQRRSSNTRR